MATRKRGANKGYTNQYGVNISKKTLDTYMREARNYNKRIDRAYNRIGDYSLLPAKVDLSKKLDEFTTRIDVTQFIKDIKGITTKNLKLVAYPQTGEAITQAELDLIKKRIRRENSRRARIKRMVDEQQEEIGFFRTDNEKVLRQIDTSKYSSLESLRRASERFSSNYQEKLAVAWRDRYLNRIEYNIQQGLIGGLDPDGNIIQKLERIKSYVESLDNLTAITRAAYGAPEMDITVIYYEDMSEPIVEQIYNAWDDFMDAL